MLTLLHCHMLQEVWSITITRVGYEEAKGEGWMSVSVWRGRGERGGVGGGECVSFSYLLGPVGFPLRPLSVISNVLFSECSNWIHLSDTISPNKTVDPHFLCPLQLKTLIPPRTPHALQRFHIKWFTDLGFRSKMTNITCGHCWRVTHRHVFGLALNPKTAEQKREMIVIIFSQPWLCPAPPSCTSPPTLASADGCQVLLCLLSSTMDRKRNRQRDVVLEKKTSTYSRWEQKLFQIYFLNHYYRFSRPSLTTESFSYSLLQGSPTPGLGTSASL